MNRLVKLMCLVVALFAMAACAKSVPNTSADRSAIQDVQHAWYRAYNAGDAAAVAALYADDAAVMAPNVPAARGIAAIRDYYSKAAREFQASGLTAAEGANSDIGISGDLAWQGYTYTVTDKSGATVEVGKSLTVFQRKDGGKWMIIRDTWNSDAAPTSAASASQVISGSSASAGIAAESPSAAPAAAPSIEMREKMATMHEQMAACLRSDKPIADCRKEAMKYHQQMMGKGGCPMMDMTPKQPTAQPK